jgi:hypothetical protein
MPALNKVQLIDTCKDRKPFTAKGKVASQLAVDRR